MRAMITLDVDVPEVGATVEQIEEWLRYELHDGNQIATSNPLVRKPLWPRDMVIDIEE